MPVQSMRGEVFKLLGAAFAGDANDVTVFCQCLCLLVVAGVKLIFCQHCDHTLRDCMGILTAGTWRQMIYIICIHNTLILIILIII